ncbi:MAG: transcription repressor NadR [Ruminococcaceae bacterium]|nr:transcription repressor NadR [Oscillospiraceae bacterium]
MNGEDRRKELVKLLHSEEKALSGGALARRFEVSRQVIVQDIALLKAEGYDIISTHYGYVMQKSLLAMRTFKVKHTSAQTEEELSLIVSLGGTVENVFVWHKVYGKIEAKLHIFSPLHIKQFIEGVRTGASVELMHITGGYHYHTVLAESEEILDRIGRALEEHSFLVPEI